GKAPVFSRKGGDLGLQIGHARFELSHLVGRALQAVAKLLSLRVGLRYALQGGGVLEGRGSRRRTGRRAGRRDLSGAGHKLIQARAELLILRSPVREP